MKKKYVAPEMEIIETEMSCIMAASPGKEEEGYEETTLAPGMVFMDDVDTEYKEDGDY